MATQTDTVKVTMSQEKALMSSPSNISEQLDFYWVYRFNSIWLTYFQADQEEPHRTRRQLIQKAHPEVDRF